MNPEHYAIFLDALACPGLSSEIRDASLRCILSYQDHNCREVWRHDTASGRIRRLCVGHKRQQLYVCEFVWPIGWDTDCEPTRGVKCQS
jgi:hypothetical protein